MREKTDGDDLFCCTARIDGHSTECGSRKRKWAGIFRHEPEFFINQRSDGQRWRSS